MAGVVDIDASDKAARFIRFCDCFNIPLISLVDVPGFLPGVSQEHHGIIRHGAKMLYAYCEATVPKITCIIRKDYGGTISAMCCHGTGADQVFAWPTAELAQLGAEAAVNVLYRREIEVAPDPEAFRKENIRDYERLFCSPYRAAGNQSIDAVIRPEDTRNRIISALVMLENKAEEHIPEKKHGNIPL